MPPGGDGFDPPAANVARNLNIGGGPRFKHDGWINLDEFPGDGMAPFGLSELRPFPLPRALFDIVYSSHCLEHLPESAISNCLREARRVVQSDGRLVIKLPDYEATLRAYRTGNQLFFRDRWGLERIAPLWANRGVEDSLESRASMIFCGFWNSAYGHEFADAPKADSPPARARTGFLARLFRSKKGILPDMGKPYHGPAAIPIDKARTILSQSSPSKIAKDLREIVLSQETDFTFNHQTAFSIPEFIGFLEAADFRIEDTEKTRIVGDYAKIPGIDEQYDISAYYVCKPV